MGKVKKIKEIELLKEQAAELTQITKQDPQRISSPHFDVTFNFTVSFEVKVVASKLLKFFLPIFWKSNYSCKEILKQNTRKKSEYVIGLCAKEFHQIREKLISSQALLSKFVKSRKEEEELKIPVTQSTYEPSTATSMFGPSLEPAQQISKSYIQNEDIEECVVCMARKPDIVLQCLVGSLFHQHAFCSECIADWHSRKNDSCPICRGETVGRGGSMKRAASNSQNILRKVQSRASYMVIHQGDYMSQMISDILKNVDSAYEQLLAKLV